MNLLLFEQSELSGFSELDLNDERARHLLEVCRVVPGQEVRVGEIGGARGTAEVVALGEGSVRLRVSLSLPASVPSRTALILAVTRPQMLKRIIQLAATLALRRVMVVGAQKVERSFFQTPILKPAVTRYHLLLGMEQGMSTYVPIVTVHPELRRFLGEEAEALLPQSATRLVGHVGVRESIRDLLVNEKDEVAVAIGPEGGWVAGELALFAQSGFRAFHLGERPLRVETAVSFALGQIELLRYR